MTARLLPAAGVDPALVANIALGLEALGRQVELGDMVVHLVIDRNSTAADTVIVPDPDGPGPEGPVLNFRVNDLWARGQSDGQLAWLGEHEGLHNWFRTDNPAFKALAVWQREAGGIVWSFHGLEAMAENGGNPVRVTPTGHLADHAGLVMSDAWHEVDGPQALSRLELAMLKDMGVRILSETHPSLLAELYGATFARAPDPAGLAYWQHSDLPLAAIAQAFFAQPEARALYVNKTPAALVDAVYHNAFGHAPDSGGAAYWQHELSSGHVREGEFVLAVISGAQGADLQHLVDIVGVSI